MPEIADAIATPQAAPVARRVLPLVAIGGRWGKTTTARLLEAMLRTRQDRLALWTNQGVWVHGRRQIGELIPWGVALRSLAEGELDLAIQELDARTVVAVGLPTAMYGLGIITSFCGNDRLCIAEKRSMIERQAQLAIAHAINPQGALVLNADDLAVADEGSATTAEPIYYSVSRSNPIVRAHLASGGRAVTISGGMIVLCEGRSSRPVLPMREVALALGGAILFQVQNALAAAAAAWHLGVSATQIAATLYKFTSAPTVMPGACNQFTIAGATILVDRLQDAFSARALVRSLRKVLHRRRRIAVLSDAKLDRVVAPDFGRLLGQSFDLIILHHDTAQETDPEVARALRTSIARLRLPPIVQSVADESAAMEKLFQQIGPNDLALVLASEERLVLRAMLTHREDAAG